MNQPNPDSGDQSAQAPETADGGNATNLSREQMARFVTEIKNPITQMGEHVLAALQQPNTMAVLTTVVTGQTGKQHIVSAALNPQQTAQINAMLQGAAIEREEEEICVGFHCLVKPKGETAE